MIREALRDVTIHEWLSEDLKAKYKLESLESTIKILHHPKIRAALLRARRTYAFTELFMFELQWLNRLEKAADNAIEINYDLRQVKDFIDVLPFDLTDAQNKV